MNHKWTPYMLEIMEYNKIMTSTKGWLVYRG